MLEQLLNQAKDKIGPLLGEQGLSMDNLDEVLKLSGDSVSQEVMSKASSGGLDQVMDLFKDTSATSSSNAVVSDIINSLSSKLGSNLGIDSSKASSLATKIVPMIIDFFGEKFRGSGKSADAAGLADFLGMDSGNILNKAKSLFGGKLGGLFGK